jgi:hypothetical protein
MATTKRQRCCQILALVCGLLVLCLVTNSASNGQDSIDKNKVKELYEKSKRGDKLTPDEQKYLDRALQELKKANDRKPDPAKPDEIDRNKVKELYEKSKRGDKLTPDEQKYLDRALQELKKSNDKKPDLPKPDDNRKEQPSTGLKPLTEMTAEDRYKGEDGGLYGGGKNEPPKTHQLAAQEALKKITPLDSQGKPAKDGKIVFISLGMSNTFGEFGMFKELADRDAQKSPDVLIVNCAVGGAGVSSWSKPGSGTWKTVVERLKTADVTPAQVQVAWIKHAEPGPSPDATPLQYAKKVKDDITASLAITRSTFPNLRVAYLSSRIYGGYNIAGIRRVNPEPFAYETAFSVRWVIQDQIESEKKGKVEGPVLLWGPYLWADGVTPRKADKLVWERQDLSQDGVHPSKSGGQKVANLLLDFFKKDTGTKAWFAKQ